MAGDNVKNRDGVNEFLVRLRTVVITEGRTSKRDQIEVSGPLTNRFEAFQIASEAKLGVPVPCGDQILEQ